MNLTKILEQFGLGDGEGNVSAMRVMCYFIVGSVIMPEVWLALSTHAHLVFTNQELGLIGGALGAKGFQFTQEARIGLTQPTTPATVQKQS